MRPGDEVWVARPAGSRAGADWGPGVVYFHDWHTDEVRVYRPGGEPRAERCVPRTECSR